MRKQPKTWSIARVVWCYAIQLTYSLSQWEHKVFMTSTVLTNEMATVVEGNHRIKEEDATHPVIKNITHRYEMHYLISNILFQLSSFMVLSEPLGRSDCPSLGVLPFAWRKYTDCLCNWSVWTFFREMFLLGKWSSATELKPLKLWRLNWRLHPTRDTTSLEHICIHIMKKTNLELLSTS